MRKGGAYSAGGNSAISTISEEGNEKREELHEGRKKNGVATANVGAFY